MRTLTARQLAHITGGQVTGDPSRAFSAVFTDSRAAIPGGLFVALRGERFDGHDFVPDVLTAGAGGAIVARPLAADPAHPDAVLIEVADTQRALELLGAALRNLHAGRFVAITGSVGKTTAKDMLAAALSAFGIVGKTPGNLNNHIGVPLTLAGLPGDEAFVVTELGMSAPGEIARLTHLARPDVALVTRAAAAHLAFFPDVDAIADAKAELYEYLAPAGLGVANADDPRVLSRARALLGDRLVTYGRAEAPGHPARHVRVIGAGHAARQLVVELAVGTDSFDVKVSCPGLHHAENVAAALACCLALDLPLRPAAAALAAGFRPARHRMELVNFGALTVLDDCYNANPTSTRAALETFADLFAATPLARRLAVLGSMRELGPTADALHADIGRLAASAAGTVLSTGPHAEALARGAAAAGATTLSAPDLAALLPSLTDWARSHPDGAVLLKGSRGERLERALDALSHTASPDRPDLHPQGGR